MSLFSMTGYGRAAAQADLGTFTVEVRSVNNRFFDFTARIPREWSAIEARLRDRVHQRVKRGKVDLWVHWTAPPDMALKIELGESMIGEIVRRFRQAAERAGEAIEIPWSDVFRLPGVLSIQPPDLDVDALFDAIKVPLDEALDQFDAMRSTEGTAMAEALVGHLSKMREVADEIEQRRGCVLEKQRERLGRLVEQMKPDVGQALSEDRIEAEVLLIADRSDITEELVRLRSHFDAFAALLDSDDAEPAGKQLDFLIQEILRETNTIGSKGRDTEISAAVVTLKHETEKAREQIQNCE